MKFFLTVCLSCCTAYASLLHAVSFTADAIQIRGDSVNHAMMFWLDGDVRFEYTENDVPMAQIFDNKNNKIIWLDNKNKQFFQRDMLPSEKVIAANKKKTNDPCRQYVDAECVFLKKTKLNGRAAEKWLITLKDKDKDFHVFQWIDTRYKNILRQENSDGSGLSVEIQEDQRMNGRNVRKLTMVAFSASGVQQQGVQWYDNELDIVIKQQYESSVVDELKDIKIGELSRDLFAVPKGYTLLDSAEKAVQQQDSLSSEVTIKK